MQEVVDTEWRTVSETECGQICKECGHIISELHDYGETEVILKEATYTETGPSLAPVQNADM